MKSRHQNKVHNHNFKTANKFSESVTFWMYEEDSKKVKCICQLNNWRHTTEAFWEANITLS
jgi:hypothetical protein